MNTQVSRRAVMGGVAAVGLGAGLRFSLPDRSSSTGSLMRSALPLPAPFTCEFRIPERLRPVTRGGRRIVHIEARVADLEILPGHKTRVWGYNGSVPGPTLDVRRAEPFRIELTNKLPVATVLHMHGSHTSEQSDGYPTDLVQPHGWNKAKVPYHSMTGMNHAEGMHAMKSDPHARVTVGERTYDYPQTQPAATWWYHDHAMGFTARNVWHGLAGMVVNRDDDDDALELPSDDHDLPIILSDRAFGPDAEMRYPLLDPSGVNPGVQPQYMGGLLGDVVLVNGVPNPWHAVDSGLYRLRVLNASNARRYRVVLADGTKQARMRLVGSDLGALARAREVASLDIAPGQRAELLLDVRKVPLGHDVALLNQFGESPHTRQLVNFKVVRRAPTVSAVPLALRGGVTEPPERAFVRRSFRFRNDGDIGWTVNGKPFDPTLMLATVKANSTEIWTFVTDMHHPVHLHQANMRVLRRGTNPPGPQDAGWQDTIDVRPAEGVEALVAFGPNRGRFVFHCHNLEHEDMDMMANFRIV